MDHDNTPSLSNGEHTGSEPMLGGVERLRHAALHSPDLTRRRRAIKLLAQQSDPANLELFLHVLNTDDDLTARKWAESGLYHLEDGSLLLALIAQRSLPAREAVLALLRRRIETGDRDLLAAVTQRYRSAQGASHEQLAWLLTAVENPLQAQAVVDVVTASVLPNHMRHAVHTMVKPDAVIEALVERLHHIRRPREMLEVGSSIIHTLHTNPEAACAAIHTRLRSPRDQPYLLQALLSLGDVRAALMWWYAFTGEARRWAVDFLTNAPHTDLAALLRAAPLRETDSLLTIAQEGSARERRTAMWLIGTLNYRGGASLLAEALDDWDSSVAMTAALALADMDAHTILMEAANMGNTYATRALRSSDE